MGFEPTTTTLATWRSTPELLPLNCPTATPIYLCHSPDVLSGPEAKTSIVPPGRKASPLPDSIPITSPDREPAVWRAALPVGFYRGCHGAAGGLGLWTKPPRAATFFL